MKQRIIKQYLASEDEVTQIQVVNTEKLNLWLKKKGGQYRVERAKLAIEIGISDAHISRILKGLVPGQQTQMLLAQKTKIKKEILFPIKNKRG